MNLIHGVVMDANQCQKALDDLESSLLATLAKPRLNPMMVVEACDALSQALGERHRQGMRALGIPKYNLEFYFEQAKTLLSKAYLIHRLNTELGAEYRGPRRYTPPFSETSVEERICPLGVLFHIAAGNMDALPFYSVVEGLLTGNINILKLPAEEGGLSVMIFQELFQIQPMLRKYVYVFDYSSRDMETMRKIADLSDAVVVWGGDAAVSSVRRMAKPDTQIIEWGHKLSFAYMTEKGLADADLHGLATHICRTDQLLCSSCQGVYLDTGSMDVLYRFCEEFLPVLERCCAQYPDDPGIGVRAQTGLRLYNASLQSLYTPGRIFRERHCSMIAYEDHAPELSIMFRNGWAKRLPRAELLHTLRPYKNHLHSVGLFCADSERDELTELLFKTGVVRITGGENMSLTYCGAAHDGMYPLRRYSKITSVE